MLDEFLSEDVVSSEASAASSSRDVGTGAEAGEATDMPRLRRLADTLVSLHDRVPQNSLAARVLQTAAEALHNSPRSDTISAATADLHSSAAPGHSSAAQEHSSAAPEQPVEAAPDGVSAAGQP